MCDGGAAVPGPVSVCPSEGLGEPHDLLAVGVLDHGPGVGNLLDLGHGAVSTVPEAMVEELTDALQLLSAERHNLANNLQKAIQERNTAELAVQSAEAAMHVAKGRLMEAERTLTATKGAEKLVRQALTAVRDDIFTKQSLLRALR